MNRSRLWITSLLASGLGALVIIQITSGAAPAPPVSPADMQATKVAAAQTPLKASTESPAALATIASYNAQTQAAQSDQAAFVATFNASGLDPAVLPMEENAVEALPSPPTLEAAADTADVIALVTVRSVRFAPYAAVLTLSVDDIAKGPAGIPPSEVNAILPFYPSRDGLDPSKTVLLFAPSTVPLFKGDRAIVLLQALPAARPLSEVYGLDRSKPVYFPQPFSGVCRVTASGQLEFRESFLPFTSELVGKTPDEVFEAFRKAATN